jgi:multiple sugar transport system substrate-binding protein
LSKKEFNNMKRIFTLITLLVIFTQLLAACAPAPTEAPAQPAAPTQAEEKPAPTEAAAPTEAPAPTEAAPTEAAPTEAAASEPVSIIFYQRGYVEGGTDAGTVNTDKAIVAFEAANPNIDVQIIGIPWTAEGDTKLEAALAAGTDINVFRVTSPNLPRYAKQGILSDIEPYLTDEDRSDFFESGFQVATVDGKVWAWPLWVTAITIFANKAMLDEKGIAPATLDDPWTWDEFVDACKKLTYKKEDGTQVYGFSASSKWGAVEYYPLMYIDGGRILSEDGTQFVQNSPEGVSAMQKIADLALVHKCTPPDFGTVDQATVRSQFLEQQNLAMQMSTPGYLPDVEKKEGFSLVVIPPPMGELDKLVTNGAFGLFAVVDTEDEAKEAAAHELAKYLTGAQVAKDVEGWQLAPGLRRSNTSYGTNANREMIAKLVEFGVYEAPVAVPAEVGTQYGAALQEVILGAKTAQQAMDDIAPVYQQALDELAQ